MVQRLRVDLREDGARERRQPPSPEPREQRFPEVTRGPDSPAPVAPIRNRKASIFPPVNGGPNQSVRLPISLCLPCQVSRLTDLPRVINFPLDTPGNETSVPRVGRQRGRAEVRASLQTWPPGRAPRSRGPGPGRAGAQAGFTGPGGPREFAKGPRGRAGRADGQMPKPREGRTWILAAPSWGLVFTASRTRSRPGLLRVWIEPVQGEVQA